MVDISLAGQLAILCALCIDVLSAQGFLVIVPLAIVLHFLTGFVAAMFRFLFRG